MVNNAPLPSPESIAADLPIPVAAFRRRHSRRPARPVLSHQQHQTTPPGTGRQNSFPRFRPRCRHDWRPGNCRRRWSTSSTRTASPFHGMIRRSSTLRMSARKAVVTDTSLVKAIEESLNSTAGCLFPYRNMATGETDIDAVWLVLTNTGPQFAIRSPTPGDSRLPAVVSCTAWGYGRWVA